MERFVLKVRQRSGLMVVLWVVLGIWIVLWAAGWRMVSDTQDPHLVSVIMFNFFMGTVALSLLWYPVSRAFRMNTLVLSSDDFLGGYPHKSIKWEELDEVSISGGFLNWSVKPNVSNPINLKKFECNHGCSIAECRTVFYGEALVALMEQLKAESSEKKRTGILLQFKKAQVERDKSFKVVPVDSLPEEEQDEARKLLKLREEIADRWAETVRMEDGK